MSYTATMKSVDTEKALVLLELEAKSKGSYFLFPCPKCEKEAVIKAYGEKNTSGSVRTARPRGTWFP